MNKPNIIAYLKPTCGWSNGVRAVFRKYDLPFEDRDIINNAAQRQEMIEKSGQMLTESAAGQGSTFHFTLPLELEGAQASRPAGQQAGAPAGLHSPCPALTGQRLLIVEDGCSSRKVLAELATQWGMAPVQAENAQQVLRECAAVMP